MKRFIYIIILCAIFASCKETPKKSNGGAKPTVTVTIEPYRYFVEQIAGDKVNVNVMVPAGSNPETYEPTAQQMVELSNSALYFKVGRIGFEETWMKKLTDNAPDMKVIDTSVGITPAKTPGGNIDPHVWMSCKNARIISRNILKALCNLLPEDKLFFEKRHQALLDIIHQKDTTIQNYVSKDWKFQHSFVIIHPTLTYFARDYQLEQYAIEEEGREASAQQIQKLIQLVRKKRIKYTLIQSEFANRNTTTFVGESGTTPIEINPLNGNWPQSMSEITWALCGKPIPCFLETAEERDIRLKNHR